MELTRRGFLGAATLATAGLALVATGCTPAEETEEEKKVTWDAEEDFDIAVVGVGVAGISACVKAAESGAKVIGIDRAASVHATNVCSVVGIYGCGEGNKELHFQHLTATSNYMFNSLFVNKYLDIIDGQVALYQSKGVEMTKAVTGKVSTGAPAIQYMFSKRSTERGDQFQAMLDSYSNLTLKWKTAVTDIIMEDGKAVAIVAEDADGVRTRYNAKGGIIVCTGGFGCNEEMSRQYMGGAWAMVTGNKACDGAGIKMLQASGAQMGKNFCYNATEGGSLNPKATCGTNVMLDTYNGLLRGTLMGDVVLNTHGKRFLDEAVLTKKTMMFCSEPVTRENCHFYTITSQKEIDTIKVKTLAELCLERYGFTITNGMVKKFLATKPVDHIDDDCLKAIEEGWAWKADTFEELETLSGVPNIAATMNEYNQMCRDGVDTYFYKDPSFLVEYKAEDGPFYLVENYMGQCCTQGGILVDENCSALTSERDAIEGLYVAGMDANLESVPYLIGATCHGFAVGSGCIAAMSCIERLK